MEPLAAGVALVAVTCVVWLLAARREASRRLGRRLAELEARLAARQSPERSGGEPDEELARLARAVEGVLASLARARRLAGSLTMALDAVPLGVVVADQKGQVLFRNQAAVSLIGSGYAEALAAKAVADLLDAALAGEERREALDLHGPPRRSLTFSGFPLRDEGAMAAAVVIEDVSERKALEAVRRDFVANVSHELKTPVGALGLLADALAEEDDISVVQRLAARMQAESFRVAQVIEDLLDLSRLEAEEAPRHEPVAVGAVISHAVDRALPAARLRGVSVVAVEVPPGWRVLGDHRQLVSALHNLLENAVKYSDPGSTVEVEARAQAGFLELSVRDHGIGIPSRDLDRIFERFYRVDRGRGRDTGGTGLGLSIVRHVAGNHGGDVLVESREGEGSLFTLRLPLGPAPLGLPAEVG